MELSLTALPTVQLAKVPWMQEEGLPYPTPSPVLTFCWGRVKPAALTLFTGNNDLVPVLMNFEEVRILYFLLGMAFR